MKELQRKEKVVAIVPAAGLGKRFGPGTNKPFQSLSGKAIIVWSLEILESAVDIAEIIPVLKNEDMEQGAKVFEENSLSKIKKIAPGGRERQDSVYNGLKLIEDKNCLVLIHDGVRPIIERDLIERTIKELKDCDGVVTGVHLRDTIKEVQSLRPELRPRVSKFGVQSEIIIKKTLNRNVLWAIQTPQVFPYNSIFTAYEKAMKEGFYSTDDAALIEKYGGKVKVIIGSYKNIKITTPEDIYIAEALLKIT